MKTILITILTVFICVLNSYTQSFPEPPQPPNSGVTFTRTTSKVSSSTSVSSTGNSYKFKSRFQNSKRTGVENILKDVLKDITYNKTKKGIVWNRLVDGEIAFECVLTKRRLKIILNKEAVSTSFLEKIEELGEDLQEYVSTHKEHTFKNRSERSLARAEIRLKRAKEEMQKSMEYLERIKERERN